MGRHGSMPDAEKQNASLSPRPATAHGAILGTPEKKAVWQELRDAGVDLINTDKLAELQEFLQSPVRKPER